MTELRNCSFKFQCPKSWDSLKRTDQINVRYCDHCKENVYFCDSSRELREAIEKNYCVAITTLSKYVSHANSEQNKKREALEYLRMPLLGRVV